MYLLNIHLYANVHWMPTILGFIRVVAYWPSTLDLGFVCGFLAPTFEKLSHIALWVIGSFVQLELFPAL